MSNPNQIRLHRITNALLRGRVLDAEALARSLGQPELGDAMIKDWKLKYAGMPHGQWAG